MKCSICENPFKANPSNPNLIDGFLCKDTGMHVHILCKGFYYKQKNAGQFGDQHKNKYSEVPVSILTINPQLLLL